MKNHIKLASGDSVEAAMTGRNIALIGKGRGAYLWVGSDDGNQACFGTVSGDATLRAFAQAILDAILERTRRRPLKRAR